MFDTYVVSQHICYFSRVLARTRLVELLIHPQHYVAIACIITKSMDKRVEFGP